MGTYKKAVAQRVFLFMRREFYGPRYEIHKLAPMAESRFWLISVMDTTGVVRMGKEQELFLQDGVLELQLATKKITHEVLQGEDAKSN